MSESATIEAQAPEETPDTGAPVEPPVVKADSTRFGRWSAFIDLGEGAEECPQHGAECADPAHFHAWVRIANGLQHREIRERALAAQARRKRLLSDPETNAGLVLEGEIEEIRAAGDKEPLIEGLLSRERMAGIQRAAAEVGARDEFMRIAYDRERHEKLQAMDESERPADEFEELGRHLAEYEAAVKEAIKAEEEPRRQALAGREFDDLLTEFRTHRIEAESLGEYLHVYGLWEAIACTFRTKVHPGIGRPTERPFHDEEDLRNVDSEALDTIAAKLDELRSHQQQAVMGGNS